MRSADMSARRPSSPVGAVSDHARLDGLSSRGNTSPVHRHGRVSHERSTSIDLASLRMDQILAAEQSSMARPSVTSPDDDEEDEESTERLLPSRSVSSLTLGSKLSPIQVVRKLSNTSPAQSSRTLPSSGSSSAITISSSPSQSAASTPTLLTTDFIRPLSSSFLYFSSSPASASAAPFHSLPSFVSSVVAVLAGLRHHPLRLSLCLVFSILLPLLVVYFTYTGKCDMSHNLAPLLRYTAQTFNEHNIAYWLDYGTLLGAAREGSIIPHEFDLDMSSTIEECEKILRLRHVFERERGYRMYGRDDWVSEKASFVFGYGGYLHKPCVRIYDPATLLYVDVDWHQRLSAAQLPSSPQPSSSTAPANAPASSPYGSVYLPRAYQPRDGDVWCNEEGFNGNDPGGCRRDSALFPLRSLSFYGVEMKVPADTVQVLRDMYGDSWRQPRPKGYKMLVCKVVGGPRDAWKVWTGVAVWEACMLALLWQLGKVDRKVVRFFASRFSG